MAKKTGKSRFGTDLKGMELIKKAPKKEKK